MIRAWMIGRIGKDAEVKDGKNGKYLTLDVATDIFHQGENKTDWVRVYCNNPRAVRLVEEKGLFKKGSLIEIQGSVTFPSAWISKKDGTAQAQNVLLADMIQFAGGKKREDANNNQAAQQEGEQLKADLPFEGANQSEDLPF